jgi:hypothetical protein
LIPEVVEGVAVEVAAVEVVAVVVETESVVSAILLEACY